jgi:hypothetical protein
MDGAFLLSLNAVAAARILEARSDPSAQLINPSNPKAQRTASPEVDVPDEVFLKHVTLAAALSAALTVSACGSSSSHTPLSPGPAAPAPGPGTTAIRLSGPEVVARVAAMYPERLAEGVSHEQRLADMEFLRDRIIEVGMCSGLTLAWNRKMNGLRSVDAINWDDTDRRVIEVVDLAMDYDNTDVPLKLQWAVVAGPAGWEPYPAQECR